MIISHKHKFIFIHIPKCAGTSITRALLPILGEQDLVLGCTPEAERLHKENLKNGGPTKHWKAKQILEHVGLETWNSYFKFCFIRNPWDLMVSRYHWSIETSWEDKNNRIKRIKQFDNFEDYMLSELASRINCIEFITDYKGNIIVDYIGKYELINWELPRICNQIGLSSMRLAKHNVSMHDKYIKYYNPLTRELVRDWYKKDIEKFSYSFNENKRYPVGKVEENKQPRKEWLIIHGAHHKAATSWFGRIYRKISQYFCWKYEVGKQNKPCPDTDTDIFMSWGSKFEFSALGPYVGTHLIRDPRDMIISGYYYHLWCNEIWCKQPVDDFNGKSYQEVLNSLSLENGISFEMSNRFKKTASSMVNWNYKNPYILELKFEEIINDIDQHFIRIFQHYGFNEKETEIAMKIVDSCKFEKITGRLQGEENPTNHYRKGIVGDWKNHFNESHKHLFKELYPGLLEKLGYEQNDLW